MTYPMYPYYQQPPMPAPPKVYPVPPARIVPFAWAATLVIATVVAVVLAIIAPFTVTQAPAVTGSVIYQSSLRQSDSQWDLRSQDSSSCAFTENGLLVRTRSTVAGWKVPCLLTTPIPQNFRLSVGIASQNLLDVPLSGVLAISQSLVVLFDGSGDYRIYRYQPPTDEYVTIASDSTNNWHPISDSGNTLIIGAQNGIFSIAINGIQVYQDAFPQDATGEIALGAASVQYINGDISDGEALFTDLSLTSA